MTTQCRSLRPMIALAACLSASLADASYAAPHHPGPQGDSWSSIAKLPDWSGIWDLIIPPPNKTDPPSLTPEYAAKFATVKAEAAKGGGLARVGVSCLPAGVPSIMGAPYPVEFLFTPGKVTMALELQSQMRRVFTDGREHPANLDPSFNGHSIGHWEGDTLVIDTVGFVKDTPMELVGDFFNFLPLAHSDEMHVIERIRLTSPDVLTDTVTVIDPKALTKPWTYARIRERDRKFDIQEYICEQNNRDSVDAAGKPSTNLSDK